MLNIIIVLIAITIVKWRIYSQIFAAIIIVTSVRTGTQRIFNHLSVKITTAGKKLMLDNINSSFKIKKLNNPKKYTICVSIVEQN